MKRAGTGGKRIAKPTGRLLGRFLTLKAILRRGGFEKGKHYDFFDPAVIRADLGQSRRLGDDLFHALSYSALSGLLYLQLERGVRPSFVLATGGLGALAVYRLNALNKSLARTWEKDELSSVMHLVGKLEKAGLKEGPVTHLVFSRHHGKLFVLNRRAAEYLKNAKPGKVFGFMPVGLNESGEKES